MEKILFICKGNVGRSQIAEAYYNQLVREEAYSAGVKAALELIYPAKDIVDLMLEEKIDVSNKLVKQLNKEMVNQAEKVIVMCEKEICPSYLKNGSGKISYWNIKDPHYLEKEEQREIKGIIKEKILSL